MRKQDPKTITLSSGEVLMIREARSEHAQELIDYFNEIAGETNFLSFGAGEFRYTKQEEEQVLRHYQEQDNQIYLIALIRRQIVGAINLHANQKSRMKHIGEFGISVRKKHWNKGIGYLLLQELISWAEINKAIRKINLTVQVENEKAIALYEKFGFEVEGRIRRDSYIDGVFYDTYRMGKLID